LRDRANLPRTSRIPEVIAPAEIRSWHVLPMAIALPAATQGSATGRVGSPFHEATYILFPHVFMKGRFSSWIRQWWPLRKQRSPQPIADEPKRRDGPLKSFDDVAIRVVLRSIPLGAMYTVDIAVRGEPVQTIVLNAEQAEQFAKLLDSAAGAVRELDRYHGQVETPRLLPTLKIMDREFYIDERLGQLRAVDNAYDFIDLRLD
jgi:hypothetical protein